MCAACSGGIARLELEQAHSCPRMATLTWSTHASTVAAWDNVCRCWLHTVCHDCSEILLCTANGASHNLSLAMQAEKWMLADLRMQKSISEGLPWCEQPLTKPRSDCLPHPVLGNAGREVDALWNVACVCDLHTERAKVTKTCTL